MLNPGGLEIGVGREVCVVWVVRGNVGLAGRTDSVTGIRPIRVSPCLRSVLGYRITRQVAAAGAELWSPPDHRHRQNRFPATLFTVGDKIVGRRSWRRR